MRRIPVLLFSAYGNTCSAGPSALRRILIAMCLYLGVQGAAISQSNRVSISLTDTTVEAILDQIRSQTDIYFVYNNNELDKCPRVSLQVLNRPVEEVLGQCLQGTGLKFEKVNNIYIIAPEEESKVEQPASGKGKGVLRGTVIDRDSDVPLPFATVIVLNTNPLIGTMTNDQGQFRIDKLPVGRHTLKISYVGYEEAVLPEIQVGSAWEKVITVAISEKKEWLGEVSLSYIKGEPLNQMATVSSRSFSVEETKRYAASISDPARMVQVFAGVTGTDDATNEIVIRGNSPHWLQWRLEGVEIPSPNHFTEEGYASGSVSILSSDMLATSDFYTGAFPAEFGNALSGVFDLRLRKGNSQRHEYSAQAGVLGIDFSAEGPFKKGYEGSYLVNYRYSTLSLINDLNIQVSENALPNYQDLAFKINLPASEAGSFSLWALGGQSDDKEKYIPDLIAGEDPERGYRDYTNSAMYAAGITHTIFPDDRSYLRTVLSHSFNRSNETYELMDSLGHLNLYLEDELQNRAYRISSTYNRKISSLLTLRTGATWSNLNYDYYSIIADTAGNLSSFLDDRGRTSLLQIYLQSKYRISEHALFTAGLHYAWFALNNDHALEPRLGFQLELPRQQKLSFGYGLHSRTESLPVYFVEIHQADGSLVHPNLELKMTRSSHFVGGYEKMFGSDIQIKTETYFQRIRNLPVPVNPEKYWAPIFGGLSPNDTLSNAGKGRNYGLELTVQKFFTKGYYGMFTASVYDSKFMPADGKWHHTKYNSNYIFNLVGGKEFMWGENRMLGLNAKIIWNGGKRVIPLDLDASIASGQPVYRMNEIYSRKTPDYFRIDFGVNIHFFRQKTEHIISLDIQNISNRRNAYAEEYDPETQGLDYYRLSGIIPILNYRIEF